MVRGVSRVTGGLAVACLVLVLGAARAEAQELEITALCSPAPSNCSGWYRQNVTVSWVLNPRDEEGTTVVSGCETRTFTADTAGTLVWCEAQFGGDGLRRTKTIQLDKTAPTVTGATPNRAADANGWYSHAIAIAFGGSDQTSGVDGCTTTTYGGPDSGAASVAGTCTDKAGNVSSPFGYGLKYDETAPAITGADPERAPNVTGWFNRPVRFDMMATDPTSGIADCPPITYGGPDSATAAFTGTCRDRAGNSSSRAFALKYDATVPTVTSGQAARPADANGWYNRPVPVAFSGADQLSGVAACTATTYGGPDGGAVAVPGTCTDKAGNVSAPLAFGLRYDGTKPVVTGGRPARAADVDGWYNRPVAVAFDGTDQTSGVSDCATGTYSGPDSGAASLQGTCTDRAGNVSSSFGYGLKYDATAPAVTGADPERLADADGWFNRPVGFTIRGSDATSGVAGCPSVTYAGPDSTVASVTGRCTDRAGNVSGRAFALKYDDTAPEVAGATPDRAPNDAGWYNRPVSLAFAGSDATSGLDACATKTYGGPDSSAASVAGTCTDKAGNISGARPFALKYDATAPAVRSGEAARPADANGWYNRPVSVAFGGTDQTSGIDACTTATYGGPDSATASVSGICDDRAGNVGGPLGFALKYDETEPDVTGATAERPPDHAGWFVDPVRFDVTGSDATSGLGECPAVMYSGPDAADAAISARCRDRAGNSSSRAFPLKYDATAPPLTGLTAAGGERSVTVSWRTTADAESAEVSRTPGLGPAPTSVVFRGSASGFVDGRVADGVRYLYRVRVQDAAGNTSSQSVVGIPTAPPAATVAAPAVPAPPAAAGAQPPGAPPAGPVPVRRRARLVAPPRGAVLEAGHPPMLRWAPVRRARYYNVQLFRGGRKILTAWPSRPRYQLELRWTYRDERERLSPGRYRWLVWPGIGPRSKSDYGERIVRRTFEVRRRGNVRSPSVASH